ncbi:MAG: glutamate---cysteine ligase / carboxylate-amine ligase [Solirubrobacterales bacterium]|jgi:carboxylate-amine ligase|nr:glutamate---cysteine ligase / carboxylate-amine ligase [Solirubrobacterales bacterium]
MALADEHRFGASAPLTLGVEEELLLVGEDLELVAAAEEAIARLEPAQREHVSTELFATQIELKTGVCADADEAAAELETARRALRAAGATLLGAGLHPTHTGTSELVDKPRYQVVQKDLAGLIDTPPSGLHVHVGMPDPETAIAVANALRYHLPLLAALCANSPFRAGEDSGMASARAAVVRAYPRFEMPPEFDSYAEFLRVADQLVLAAGVDDYTYLWWDVRPHPRLGTVEVRAMDVQPGVAANAAVAALVQALAAKEIEVPSPGGLAREALEESYFQAGRHGLEARILVADGTAVPARELGRRVLDEAAPYAVGGADSLAELERVLAAGNGAEEQRRLRRELGLEGLLRTLVERTAARADSAGA